jgi:NADH dehydrogenase (ubiquinone) Fe-S protein 6
MLDQVVVDADIESISCNGGDDDIGHPTVYYNFGEKTEVVCGYCGKKFLKKKNNHE